MASFNYIDVPSCATRLQPSHSQANDIRPAPKIRTTFPHPEPDDSSSRSSSPITSPTKNAVFNILPSILLSSSMPPSGPIPNPRKAQRSQPPVPLLSAKDPLSIQITSVNFKRFVERVGPVFWLQDRVEEIIMWRCGWKLTTVWMAAYAFLCYFPRLILLLPHITIVGIILATRQYPVPQPLLNVRSPSGNPAPSAQTGATGPAVEGSVDWQANIQAIQNLMGFYSDAYTLVQPFIPHLSHKTPQTPHILSLLALTLLPAMFLVSSPFFPIRSVCLCLGIVPLLLTNPFIRPWIAFLLYKLRSPNTIIQCKLAFRKVVGAPAVNNTLTWLGPKLGLPIITSPLTSWKSIAQRIIDDDALRDECWNAPMREVELFENERLDTSVVGNLDPVEEGDGIPRRKSVGGWSKANLRPGERKAWTRGRDGWSGVGAGGAGAVSSNLTFSLDPGWFFVDTEDWRADTVAAWASQGLNRDGDSNGWVYTNDSWLDPRPHPHRDHAGAEIAVTRRRRWVRRVWYDAAKK